MSDDTDRHAMKMAKKKAARDKIMAKKEGEKGLIIVHTGPGKGKSSSGFGMILRCAMNELPNYTATSTPQGVAGEEHTAMQFVCPSLDYLDAAYGDYLAKRPSANPALIGMTPGITFFNA